MKWCSVRSWNGFFLLGIGTIALLFPQPVRAQVPNAESAGIESNQAFALFLAQLADSNATKQPELMYRVVDLPDSRLDGTVASVPLARYEAEAKPNSIGLLSVHFAVVSDRDGINLRLRRVQFNFAKDPEVDRLTCAKFDAARAALGLDTSYPAPPIPMFQHGQSPTHGLPHSQEGRRVSGHSTVYVSTDYLVKPCLRSAVIEFRDPVREVHADRDQKESP